MPQPITNGAHHIGLSVANLSEIRSFFVDTLGFSQIGEVPDYPAVFVSDGTVMITLWQVENPESATQFDRRNNIGLHHFALQVPNLDALNEMHERLGNAPRCEIEFAPENLGNGPMQHMMCTIPGGIRMEVIFPGK